MEGLKNKQITMKGVVTEKRRSWGAKKERMKSMN
jgi:hypothetical protein